MRSHQPSVWDTCLLLWQRVFASRIGWHSLYPTIPATGIVWGKPWKLHSSWTSLSVGTPKRILHVRLPEAIVLLRSRSTFLIHTSGYASTTQSMQPSDGIPLINDAVEYCRCQLGVSHVDCCFRHLKDGDCINYPGCARWNGCQTLCIFF